ncbi:MAG: integral rane sensor signal transduction histidine kinase [Verrucomicrobia bacterium]|nr:integral rane sensor signal transduction histidine kinase [Verrucomicrobiota bacterium]
MLIFNALFVSVVVVLVGLMIFWANPGRMVNRTVFTSSLHVALWLAAWHMGAPPRDNGLFWMRWTCVIGAMAPMHFWLVKESITGQLVHIDAALWKRAWRWLLVTTPLAIVPLTGFFVPATSTETHRIFGWGYYGYIVTDFLLYAYLFRDAVKSIRTLTGGRRVELQVWLGGCCGMATIILARMALSGLTRDQNYIHLQPLAILVCYTGATYAITMHRIFDARQIVLVGLEKITLVASVAGVAFMLDRVLGTLLPEPAAFLATTILALWFAATLNGWLDRLFQFYSQAAAARQATFDVARRETRGENLEEAFQKILKGWGQSDRVVIVSGAKDAPLKGSGVEIPQDSTAVSSLRHLRWVTPERLAREKATPGRAALSAFLTEQELGVLVISEGNTLCALVGVGVAASRRPFTYPQVTQLIELASIMENALERVHFSVKAQRAEQLATVGLLGASLAHEIRNPLVSIKAFVQLLPKHYQDAAFRDKFFRLIGDEVMRIDRLTEQLLDLASPRVYSAEMMELHPVLLSSLELASAKAADKNIPFTTDLRASPDRVYTDGSAAKQVLLNLCFNAIQAVEAHNGEKWVKLATRNVPNGIEVTIEDSGPGISPEIRPRLFQPFQSTKSSGFGLGLAICSDILAGLDATIAVDPNLPGRGATFRIVFPCQA